MNEKILVVEDEPDVLKFLMMRLEKKQYKLLTARDGQEALDLIGAHPIDLILLDIKLPKMDGYEVCGRIKSNPALAAIPVLFITADSSIIESGKLEKLRADDCLLKPYEPADLYIKIDELLCKQSHPQ